jgi:hypothetical protein
VRDRMKPANTMFHYCFKSSSMGKNYLSNKGGLL